MATLVWFAPPSRSAVEIGPAVLFHEHELPPMCVLRDDTGRFLCAATSAAPEWFVAWEQSQGRDINKWGWDVIPAPVLDQDTQVRVMNSRALNARKFGRVLQARYGWAVAAGKLASILEVEEAIDRGYEQARELAAVRMDRARQAVADEGLWALLQERLHLDAHSRWPGILAHWLEVMLRRGREATAEALRRQIDAIRFADWQEGWAERLKD